MNCKEAHELFGLMPDLPKDHPQRRMVEWHILGCESCAAEYQAWQESLDLMHEISFDVSDEAAEAMNRRVMDRIYAESPWLVPDAKQGAYHKRFRRRVIIWAACFIMIFISSILFYAIGGFQNSHEVAGPATGILPATVVDVDADTNLETSFTLSNVSRGFIEPFVVQMGPVYPQYWMVLSMVGMALALISWKGISKFKR